MSRVLVGFNMVGRGTARHGRPIMRLEQDRNGHQRELLAFP